MKIYVISINTEVIGYFYTKVSATNYIRQVVKANFDKGNVTRKVNPIDGNKVVLYRGDTVKAVIEITTLNSDLPEIVYVD